jgi:hypothetical protein
MIPTSDSDYEHDDPNPKPGNSKGSAAGYSRMKALFEWVIHKATRLLLDLDAAKTAGNAGNYATARTNYLNLLAGLNGTGGNPGALGYSVIKWVYVNPTIRAGRIEGATLILQWNPHSSSSMIHK